MHESPLATAATQTHLLMLRTSVDFNQHLIEATSDASEQNEFAYSQAPSYSLKAGGQCDLKVTRQRDLKAGEQCDLKAGEQCDLKAGEQYDLKVKGQCDLKVNGQCDLKVGDQCDLKAKGQCDFAVKSVKGEWGKESERGALRQKFKAIKQRVAVEVSCLSERGLRKIIRLLEAKVQEKAAKVEQRPSQVQLYAASVRPSCALLAAPHPHKLYRIPLTPAPAQNAQSHQQYNYRRSQTVAKVFCERQYGYSGLLSELSKSNDPTIIPAKKYVLLANKVVSQAYLLLQHFLLYECGARSGGQASANKRRLTWLLLHCKKQLDYRCCSTFIKFVTIAYALADVQFTQQEAVDLYNAVATRLAHPTHGKQHQSRVSAQAGKVTAQGQSQVHANKTNQHPRKSKMFSQQEYDRFVSRPQIYADLMSHFRSGQPLSKITDYFRSKYAQQTHLFQPHALKTTLCQTIARALQKLHSIIEAQGSWKLPRLQPINYESIEQLCLNHCTGKVCGELIGIYLSDGSEIRRKRKVLSQIIRSFNSFLSKSQKGGQQEDLHIIQ